jgi:hypothetical protein
MNLRRVLAVGVIALTAISIGIMDNGVNPPITRAQTTQVTGQPVNVCGIVGSFTPSSSAVAGSISFTENGSTTTLGIQPNVSFSGVGPSLVGFDYCLSGVVNASGQLVVAHVLADVPQSATACGTATYVPATATTLGVLSIAGSPFTVAAGTNFTGSSISNGSNMCVALTINSLGQVTGGTVQTNGGSTASNIPVELCGTVTAYTAATSSAAGSITFKAGNETPTYTLPAGETTSGFGTITVGQDLCFVAVIGQNNTVSASALFMSNVNSTFVTCGLLTNYQAAGATTLGVLALGNSTSSVAYGVQPTGDLVVANSQMCVTGQLNGLGQISAAAIQLIQVTGTTTVTTTPTGTATPNGTTTPTATAAPTSTFVPVPPPPSFGTATPTSTPVPPATNTPLPTATSTATPVPPKPKARASFQAALPRYKTVRIGTKEMLSVQTGATGVQRLVVRVYFATGRQLGFNTHTKSSGAWNTTFIVPPNTISGYSHTAVVTFQTYKNHTTAKSFNTFKVIR